MVASAVQVAKRALLATMRAAAVVFGLSMSCNRDSPDKDVVSFFRKLSPSRCRPRLYTYVFFAKKDKKSSSVGLPHMKHILPGMTFGGGQDPGGSA